jgi:hypothetical protein
MQRTARIWRLEQLFFYNHKDMIDLKGVNSELTAILTDPGAACRRNIDVETTI